MTTTQNISPLAATNIANYEKNCLSAVVARKPKIELKVSSSK